MHESGVRIYWSSAFNRAFCNNVDVRSCIIRTAKNEELRFFAAGMLYERGADSECWRLIVRHDTPHLYCVDVAHQSGLDWIINC